MNITAGQIVQYAGYAVAVLTALISLYKSYKSGQNVAEMVTILVNTLKDENKMVDGAFSQSTLDKAKEVAVTIGANDMAVEQVKTALQGRELDLKVASYRGKPVYLSDVIGYGSIAQRLIKIFRK